MNSKLDEEINHLAKIRCIAMGIKKSESRKRVFPKRGNDFVAGFGGKLMNIHAFSRRNPGELKLSSFLVFTHVVCGWRWEESQFGRHV